LLATALVLVAPLVAMQSTDEVDWKPGDFTVAGVLLLGSVLLYELAARSMRHIRHRAVIGAAIVVALALLWVELAVGIFGTPVAGS
jgi:hypothetical protein